MDEIETFFTRDDRVPRLKELAMSGLAVEAMKEIENGSLSGDHGGSILTGKPMQKFKKLSR